jgi:hypothetical protein
MPTELAASARDVPAAAVVAVFLAGATFIVGLLIGLALGVLL